MKEIIGDENNLISDALQLLNNNNNHYQTADLPPFAVCWTVRYVGSFLVSGTQEARKSDFVRKQLIELSKTNFSRSVLLVVSLHGIKVCSIDAKEVHMAHAVKRVSYATCDPDNHQFAFLAREPKRNISGKQFCHVFATETPEEAKEINSIVGRTLQEAYLYGAKQENEKENNLIMSKEHSKLVNNVSLSVEVVPVAVERQSVEDGLENEGLNEPNIGISCSPKKEIGKLNYQSGDREVKPQENSLIKPHLPLKTSTMERKRNQESPKSKMNGGISENETNLARNIAEKNVKSGRISAELKLRRTSNECDTSNPYCHIIDSTYDVPSVVEAEHCFSNRGSKSGPLRRKQRPMSMFVPNSSRGFSPQNLTGQAQKNGCCLIDWAQSSGDLTAIEKKKKTGGIMRKIFGRKRQKSESPPLVDPNQSVSASDSVSVRSGKRGKRRPMSEIFSDAFRGFSLNAAGQSADSADGAEDQKEVSPRLSVKSLNLPARKGKNRNKGSMGLMDKKMRRSANLEQLYRLKENSATTPDARSLSCGMNRLQLRHSPGGTGCGKGCQFMGVSPEIAHKNAEFLLPVDYQDEMRLQGLPWFHSEASREAVVKVLKESDIGSFVVRRSASHKCCLAISVRVPVKHNFQKVSHYLILKTNRGFKLKGFLKAFHTVQNLVTHHSFMAEMLPCRLKFVNWDSKVFANPSNSTSNLGQKSENSTTGCGADSEEIYGHVIFC